MLTFYKAFVTGLGALNGLLQMFLGGIVSIFTLIPQSVYFLGETVALLPKELVAFGVAGVAVSVGYWIARKV